jgi:hypothetical protein
VLALATADVGLIGALHTKENFPEIPPFGGRSGGQYRQQASTVLSTGQPLGAEPEGGVSPTVLHSCGGTARIW